jgi:UDP-glucose:(heptosyl)LPS alpha-1,3-glucosyltransferase
MSQRTRVLFVVESATDVRMLEGLAEHTALHVLVRRVTAGTEVNHAPIPPIEIERGPGRRLSFCTAVFARILRDRHRIDVVVVQGYGPAALAANSAGRLTRTPTIMLVCSPTEAYYRCRKSNPLAGRRFRITEMVLVLALARINALLGQRYIVLSEYLATVVRSHGTRRPVRVVPVYGVDTRRFAPPTKTKAHLRSILGLPRVGQIILFSSRVAPEKDVRTLLAAFRELLERRQYVWLLHCSGGYREFLQLAQTYGVADRVIARGAVHPQNVLPYYIQASDVCVQASCEEGLGFSVLEAFACDVPVVASDRGGLRETVIPEKTGWTYDANDSAGLASALESALADPVEALRRARKGRQLVLQSYDRDVVFKTLRDSFAECEGIRVRRAGRVAPGDAANRDRPRVALIAHEIHSFGGMDRALTELIQRGIGRCDFVVVSGHLAEELKPLVQWKRVPIPRSRFPFPVKFALFFIVGGLRVARLKADLRHVQGAIVPNRVDLVSVQFCHAAFRRVLRTSSRVRPSLPRWVNGLLSRGLSIAAERLMYRPKRVGVLAAASSGVQEELQLHYPGVPTIVTPNGVDFGRFRPDGAMRRIFRLEQHVMPDDVVVLFVGGDWERKGTAIAIEAVARAARQCDDMLRLWVVGQGDAQRFRSLALEHGVADRVTFFGSRGDTERFFQASDVFVFPTIYEAFPLAVLEAAASALPLVVTAVNGVEELVHDGGSAIVVEPTAGSVARALVRLVHSPSLRAELGEAARLRAREFTWQRSVESVLSTYTRLLGDADVLTEAA